MTLKELAAAVGMDTGHVHLYLTSFRMIGLLQQAGHGGAWSLGPYALELGLAALRKLDLAEAAQGPMLELQHQTGLTAYLSIWGNVGPTIVRKVDGNFPFPMSISIGYVLPLLSTGTGRVFLSYLPVRTTLPIIEREANTLRGPAGARLDASPAALNRIVKQVRTHGITQAGSATNVGFIGMSSPVFNHEGHICAAMSMLGPVDTFDVRLGGEPARALRDKAQALSRTLGFVEVTSPVPVFGA